MARNVKSEKRQITPEFRAYQKIYLNFEYSKITTIKVE